MSTQNTYNSMSRSFKYAQPLPFYNKKGFWYILCGGHLEKWPPCWIFRWLTGFSQKVGSRHHSCQIWCLYHKVITTIVLEFGLNLPDYQDKIVFKLGMNLSKTPPHIKMADFLLEWQYGSKRVFLCVWSWGICIPNVILLCTCGRRGWTGTTRPKTAVKPQRNNDTNIFCDYSRELTGLQPARIIIYDTIIRRTFFSLIIGTSQVCDLLGP